MNLIKLN